MQNPKQPGWKGSPVGAWTDGDDTASMELDSHIADAISIVQDRRREKPSKAGFDPYDKKR